MSFEKDDEKYDVILEFIKHFPSVSPPPTNVEALCDGVAFFEVLSIIAPRYFDASNISRNVGDNWALKSSNLRKLTRNMQTYFKEGLRKTTDFSVIQISNISRNADKDAIVSLFELIAAAAVLCENRVEIVGQIMDMPSHSQFEMKRIIEAGMARLADDSDDDGEVQDDGGEKELVFNRSMDDESYQEESSFGPNFSVSKNDASVTSDLLVAAIRERDELRDALEEARRELSSVKNEHSYSAEDIEIDNIRLRDMSADLQERLDKNQKALHAAELAAAQAKRQLEEAKAEAVEWREKNAQLEDELDIARAKSLQLHKAEATVLAYKKKLDSVGVISQQIQEMEDQSTSYLRQIIDLENDNKQIPGLNKKIETLQEQMHKLEVQITQTSKDLDDKNALIAKLKSELASSVNAKKLFEEELSEIRSMQSHNAMEDHDISSFSLGPSTSTAQLKEKIIRLEHDNDSLKKQVSMLQSSSNTGIDDMSQSHKSELERKDAKIKQLSQEKAKLEAYSKMTLAKFQEKYMVAIQECKKQLKEKTEKIEQLEMRAAVEKAGHKREEQLLSSSIYELGLSIMQNNLSKR